MEYVALVAMVEATDAVGVQRALGSAILASCSDQHLAWFLQLDVKHSDHLSTAFAFSESTHQLFDDRFDAGQLLADIADMKVDILSFKTPSNCLNQSTENLELSLRWFANITLYLDNIIDVAHVITTDIEHAFDLLTANIRNDVTINAIVMTLATVACLATTIWYVSCVKAMTRSITSAAMSMHAKSKELTLEKRRTEALLFEILPREVARKSHHFGYVRVHEHGKGSQRAHLDRETHITSM